MSANFTPELNSYTDLTPFRYWCQKVLPLVYDDSLSYYELLCKVIDYLNKTMEDVNLAVEDVGKLHDAYDSLQTYVNNYFANLDVQEEINNKLDEMVEDGTIRDIFSEDVQDILNVASEAAQQAIADIPENVTDWLEEHITQETGYVIDDTLTVQGAAADAKKTGDEISALKSDLNQSIDVINGNSGLTPFYKPLVIGSTGKWTSETSFHICIPVNAGDTVELKGNTIAAYYAVLTDDSAIQTQYAAYSEATGFTTRILINANATASFTVPADGKYLYCNTIDTQGRVQIPVSIKINGVEQTYNIRKKIDAIAPEIMAAEARALAKAQWASNIIASQASTKTIHFSCDDVTFLSALLADPAPASIWDVPELGALKTIHDNSGACITLMLFNEVGTYDISDIPNTWATEFQSAKSWLKFGFHAKTTGTNYSTDTTAVVDYTKFVNAVYAFTGDYDCIDRVPRLAYYAGTLNQLKAMQALDYGPVGFLTADDIRLSYYLDDTQNTFVNAHGRYFDVENMFIFVPTIARLDTGATAQTGIDAIIARGAKADMYIEIFCHASGTSSGMITRMQRFQTVAEWATQHGYVNGFLTNYFA